MQHRRPTIVMSQALLVTEIVRGGAAAVAAPVSSNANVNAVIQRVNDPPAASDDTNIDLANGNAFGGLSPNLFDTEVDFEAQEEYDCFKEEKECVKRSKTDDSNEIISVSESTSSSTDTEIKTPVGLDGLETPDASQPKSRHEIMLIQCHCDYLPTLTSANIQ